MPHYSCATRIISQRQPQPPSFFLFFFLRTVVIFFFFFLILFGFLSITMKSFSIDRFRPYPCSFLKITTRKKTRALTSRIHPRQLRPLHLQEKRKAEKRNEGKKSRAILAPTDTRFSSCPAFSLLPFIMTKQFLLSSRFVCSFFALLPGSRLTRFQITYALLPREIWF